jgi:hypothetical protein
MKRFSFIYTATVTAILLFSCSDFLDREPVDVLSPERFSTETDVLNAVNGIYRKLIQRNEHRIQPLSQDFMSDDAICKDPKYGELILWRGEQTPDDDGCVLDKWSRNYAGILRANTVLHNISDVYVKEDSIKNRYMAEALFLRAYFYADLVDFFGDVPFRIEPEGIDKKESPRVAKETVIANILLDLNTAIHYLPVTYSAVDYGRATKGAAMALKARICLYNGLWDMAISACRDVIALNKYELHPSYAQLFTIDVEKTNKEVIFSAQYIANKNTEGLSNNFWSKLSANTSYLISYNLVEDYYMKSTGLRYDSVNSGYVNTAPFSNRDPRFTYTILLDESNMGKSNTGFRVKKLVEENPLKLHNNGELDYPLIRYADVLLMLAVALVESGNYSDGEVISFVNQIRQRPDVQMPSIESVEGKNGKKLSQKELREIIRHERRVEFPLEGLRLSDIKRWDLGETNLTDCYTCVKNQDGTYDKAVFMSRTFNAAKGYLWPIPYIEIQTNPVPNNPGYY